MNISLENVSAGYSRKNYILNNISAEFEAGKIHGILGPNGSGKTTLLRVLSGILPYDGEIRLSTSELSEISIHNKTSHELSNLSRKSLSKYIALTPQISSMYFSYTVYDTIMMGRFVHQEASLKNLFGQISDKDREIVDIVIEKMKLDDLRSKNLDELSGGQLQRVLLARTFAQTTPVILLDEPNSHLDFKFNNELLEHIRDWIKGTTEVDGTVHKNTLISIFHDIALTSYISDEILLLKNGNIIKKGPTQDVLSRDLINDIYETDVTSYYELIHGKLF